MTDCPPPDATAGRRADIAAAFDQAAAGYDRHAVVQRLVAGRLAARIARLPLPPRPRILEIGCGTGLLSQALRQQLGPARWLFTDLAPAMVGQCRDRLGNPADAGFLVMDGERPCLAPAAGSDFGEVGPGGFDLICSSLAFQWIQAPVATLRAWAALLAPGGHIAFATLGADSFQEWRAAHAALGLDAGTAGYPGATTLQSWWPAGGQGQVESELICRPHDDGLGFLTELKGIGAGLPAAGYRPLPAGGLRRILRRFAPPAGLTATYQILYAGFRRHSAPPRRGVFITGTDTGIGKTLTAACLVKAWQADYWKPLQTGLAEDPGDTGTVAQLAGLTDDRRLTPAVELAAPLSPQAAAALAGITIDPAGLTLPPASGRPLVIEGAGGLLVPVAEGCDMIDLIGRFGLPALLVARSTLGTINHTLLSLEALRNRGLAVAGVVLVGPPHPGNRAAIEQRGQVRVLAEIPPLATVDPATIAGIAEQLFTPILSWLEPA